MHTFKDGAEVRIFACELGRNETGGHHCHSILERTLRSLVNIIGYEDFLDGGAHEKSYDVLRHSMSLAIRNRQFGALPSRMCRSGAFLGSEHDVCGPTITKICKGKITESCGRRTASNASNKPSLVT